MYDQCGPTCDYMNEKCEGGLGRPGLARPGQARPGEARPGQARPGLAVPGKILPRLGLAWSGRARPSSVKGQARPS